MAASRGIAGLRSDGSTGNFRKWLWKITKNKLIDFRRRYPESMIPAGGSTAAVNLHQIAEAEELSDVDPSSPDMLRELMLKALELVRVEFKDASWKAFWRSSIDGLPTEVVANELGTTAAAVRQARSRIMRRLRIELGDLDNSLS